MAQRKESNCTHEDAVLSQALLSGSVIQRCHMSCGVGRRRSSDPELLRLWQRSAAVALIGPLARELPCAVGVALKKKKDGLEAEHEKLWNLGWGWGVGLIS